MKRKNARNIRFRVLLIRTIPSRFRYAARGGKEAPLLGEKSRKRVEQIEKRKGKDVRMGDASAGKIRRACNNGRERTKGIGAAGAAGAIGW